MRIYLFIHIIIEDIDGILLDHWLKLLACLVYVIIGERRRIFFYETLSLVPFFLSFANASSN